MFFMYSETGLVDIKNKNISENKITKTIENLMKNYEVKFK